MAMNKEKAKELILYVVFGILTTLVSWGSYTVFVNALHFSVAVANVLSWILSVAFAFVTNKIWVFNSKKWEAKLVFKEIITFVSSRAVTGVMEIVGVPVLAKIGFDNLFYSLLNKMNLTQEILFTDGIYSKIAFSVVIVILNYVLSKLFVFKNKSENSQGGCK